MSFTPQIMYKKIILVMSVHSKCFIIHAAARFAYIFLSARRIERSRNILRHKKKGFVMNFR